jgi:hypothetical protein
MNGCLPTRVSLAARRVQFYLRLCRYAFSELLGKRDRDDLRTANVAEPVHILVLGDIANELSAMCAQARQDVLDIVDGEHDATYAQGVHWCVLWLSSDRRRCVELVQLDPPVTVRSAHQREGSTDVLKANETIYR